MTTDRILTRRQFIGLGIGAAGASLLGPAIGSADRPERRPNLLIILPDQLRAVSLGCSGNSDVRTPNIDRLAAQGIRFTDAISTTPVCTPYRASLLTGRFATTTGVATNGVELPDSEITIAEVLKAAGYRTGYIGKWHLEKNNEPFVPKSRRQGFDYWAVRNNGGPHWDSTYCTDTPELIKAPGYVPDVQTKLASEFIEANKKQPFCLFVSYGPPHPQYDPPDEFYKLYDPAKLKQRPNVPGDSYRDTLAHYYGSISAIDGCVGGLMESLDKAKLAEDTIVIFTSDHGDMMGSYDRIGKNVPWDEAINVPFIVRYPRRVKGKQKSDALLCTVDIMPTLLALCGARAPKAVQGRDLSGFVLGKGGKKPESVLVQRLIAGRDPSGIREWRAIRTDRYTYARGKDKPWLLFDNQKDPYQMTNLIDKPESKFLREKLDAELQSWLKRIGDDFAPADEWRRRVRPHASKRLNREEE